jgi:hypothetical protein
MNTPCSIPYNPSLQSLAAFGALGITIIAVNRVAPFGSPFFLSAAAAFIALSVALLLRRLLWKRSLVVTEDAISVPSGFLRLRPRQISFASIQRVWVTRLFRTDVLRVRTNAGDVEIHDIYLPETKMLWELKRFLESRGGHAKSAGEYL